MMSETSFFGLISDLNNKMHEILRVSFMDIYARKETNPNHSNRIDLAEAKRLYLRRGSHKISLNDQLGSFYIASKCQRVCDHEVVYYFHTEHLEPNELDEYQKQFLRLAVGKWAKKDDR